MSGSGPDHSGETIDEHAAPRPEEAVLIVCGAHLRAEWYDRPIAYRLRAALAERGLGSAIVVSDVWYLNRDELRHRPTVSVGGPEVNALSAYLGARLPSAYVVDGVCVVQFDVDSADAVASCWGAGAEGTLAAVEAFVDRYAGEFVARSGSLA